MKRQILLGLMVMVTAVSYADQAADVKAWTTIIEKGTVVGADTDVQRAIIKVGVEFHTMITVIAKKYAKELSPAEKKLVKMFLNQTQAIIKKAKVLMISGGEDKKTQQELQEMVNTLIEFSVPLQVALQEKAVKGGSQAMKDGQRRLMFAIELFEGLLQAMVAQF